jgi:NAD(P)-dependent dehydrogenase (short-subunit alcohol dehydrogenase family)
VIFFVTGGSRGIGEAIVVEAARAGHDVAFTYLSGKDRADQLLAALKDLAPKGRFFAYPLDVRSSAAVEEIGDRVLDDLGTVDVVVANAGVNRNALAANMSDEDWQFVLDTNLTGTFYVCRQFLPTMMSKRFGRIIMISSLGAKGVTGQAAYAASKSGMLGLSSTLAKEYGRKGITSNVLILGFFETDMTREGMSESNRKFWLDYNPRGRLGDLSEIAKTVMFLSSDGAGYINGDAIDITGGLDWAP